MSAESQGTAPKGAGGGHTPGEWVVGPQIIARVDGIETAFASVEQPGFVAGGGIALVHVKHGEWNARLIAAAPELLAAAEHSAAALRSAGVEPNADSDNPLEWLLHETLAALAKAGGES